jgi:hypothetical protein
MMKTNKAKYTTETRSDTKATLSTTYDEDKQNLIKQQGIVIILGSTSLIIRHCNKVAGHSYNTWIYFINPQTL